MVKAEHMGGRLGDMRGFIGGLYGPDLHAKRVDALVGATLGVMAGASLAVAMIGQSLAQARGLVTKHAVKQVDRLMSNSGIDVWDGSVANATSGCAEWLCALHGRTRGVGEGSVSGRRG